jgi:hypothetical protein
VPCHQAARSFAGGFFIVALQLLLSGCASLQTERLLATAGAFPAPVEISGVPFFAQDEYQCGPAALATVLTWSGVNITPEQLTPQIYVPQRQGSLQPELIAATRRHGRVPYVLQPHIEMLATEIASGQPVLVLQNLGSSFYSKWHYAVVVGFDLARGEIVLRSGREQRHVVALTTFERTWARGEYWAMVALPPERLPYTAEEFPYLESVAALERLGMIDIAEQAYRAALNRWPRSLPALMGLGNTLHARGDLPAAEEAFRTAVKFHPRSAPAHNNLAQTLADLKRYDEAEAIARTALSIDTHGPLHQTFQKTLDDVLQRRAAE